MSNMNPWTLLVLGIFVGWFFGWLLELWFFRRRRLQCQRDNSRLEAQLRARNAELGAANSQISALRGELGTRAKEIDALLYQLAKQEDTTAAEPLADVRKPFPVTPEASLALDTLEETTAETDIEDETWEPDVPQRETPQADAPDDMTLIAGVGPKYATLLQEHGITTFAQLGASDPAALAQIFEGAGGRTPDFLSWIEQAQAVQAGD